MTSQSELKLLDQFERALINDRLHMFYQPKVRLRDGSLACVEALVRWDDPKLGSVEPSRFVPLAERHGLIDQLTMWGLKTALRHLQTWKDEGLDVSVAFNISALSLKNLGFPDEVERLCQDMEVATDKLVLELTEGATQPLVKLMDTLTRCRIKGIGLAIDDFGTGYSTLAQLRQLPFTEVKIDRSFVADAPSQRDSRLIVQAIIDLARGLGMTSTAEGVETEDQLRLLHELGCDLVQGYLLSQPIAPDALAQWQSELRRRWPALLGSERLALWSSAGA